ncbi:MAG TPA: hypothetical protein DCF33_07250, partial [Saprospirales bacterium]|nr:hypothetical protein [Saprospirales bacterium]
MEITSRISQVQNHRLSFLLFLALASCARQGAPAGGPKDTRPPEVDSLRSSPNRSTRFEKRKIELLFDEWVVLSDVATQIVVSPPLAKKPEVVLNGRKVVLTFEKNEVLRPNTTYTINFGNSVKDLHEGNPAKDLRYVFSTGDFIDSLGFKGQITDAFSGEPVENVAVLLHENLSDTAIRKERPYYFTRTDKTGQYSFENLRSGTFQIVAVEDADQNLKWSGENEKIAFLDQSVAVSDSLKGPIALRLFKDKPAFRLQNQQTGRYGFVRLVFNTSADSAQINFQWPSGTKVLQERAPDSLTVWYDLPSDTSWNILIAHPEWMKLDSASGLNMPYTDTVRIKKLSRSDFMEKHRLGFGDEAVAPVAPTSGKGRLQGPASAAKPVVRQPAKTIIQLHTQPAELPFNYPVIAVDTSKWQLMLDTVPISNFTVSMDSLTPGKVWLTTEWKQGKAYSLSLLPGG